MENAWARGRLDQRRSWVRLGRKSEKMKQVPASRKTKREAGCPSRDLRRSEPHYQSLDVWNSGEEEEEKKEVGIEAKAETWSERPGGEGL